MRKASTAARIDEQGRLTIPKPAREQLGVDGKKALLSLEIEVEEEITDDE